MLNPLSAVCKHCDFAVEACCLDPEVGTEDFDTVLTLQKTNPPLKRQILRYKAQSSGQFARNWPEANIKTQQYVVSETERYVPVVEQLAFIEHIAAAQGQSFASIPKTRDELRLVNFVTEEGKKSQGIALAPGTVPADVLHKNVRLRYGLITYLETTPSEHSETLHPDHQAHCFNKLLTDAINERSGALQEKHVGKLLSFEDWRQTMRDVDAKNKAKEAKDKEEQDPERDQALRSEAPDIVSHRRLGTMRGRSAAATQEAREPIVARPKGGTRKAKTQQGVAAPSTPLVASQSRPSALSRINKRFGSPRAHGPGGSKATPKLGPKIRSGVRSMASAPEPEDSPGVGGPGDASQRYWNGPKEMNDDFMVECIQGRNHNRTIEPATPLVAAFTHTVFICHGFFYPMCDLCMPPRSFTQSSCM